MKKVKWKVEIVVATIVIAIILLVAGYYVFINSYNASKNKSLQTATVTDVLDITKDGGFTYQHVIVSIPNTKKDINLKIKLVDSNLENINTGDKIYIKQINYNSNDFVFAGYKRFDNLIWIIIIFTVIMVITLGKAGIKYIFPSLLLFILVASGVLTALLTKFNPYIISLIILAVIAYTTILIQVQNFKIALLVTIAQIITLSLILLMNLILFKISFLIEPIITTVNITLTDYWAISNTVIIYLAFGTSINTTFDVVNAILIKKQKYNTSDISSLLREGSNNTKIVGGRNTNNLFFILFGMSLSNILFYDKQKYLHFIDDPIIARNLILFINAALATLIVTPIASILTVLYLSAGKEKDQYSFL